MEVGVEVAVVDLQETENEDHYKQLIRMDQEYHQQIAHKNKESCNSDLNPR